MKRKLSAALCTALVLAGLTAGCGDPETKPVQLEGAVYMETGNEEKISGNRRVTYFQETSEILHNPGMGWVLLEEPLYPGRATLGWQGDFPEADSVSLSLSWGNVEAADGKYDWSEMDKAIDYWTSLGKKINMRLATRLKHYRLSAGGSAGLDRGRLRRALYGRTGRRRHRHPALRSGKSDVFEIPRPVCPGFCGALSG